MFFNDVELGPATIDSVKGYALVPIPSDAVVMNVDDDAKRIVFS